MSFYIFNDTATTEIYTLSLHDALPISVRVVADQRLVVVIEVRTGPRALTLGLVPSGHATTVDPEVAWREYAFGHRDRKSTRLNSSHANISYAVFCLKIYQ